MNRLNLQGLPWSAWPPPPWRDVLELEAGSDRLQRKNLDVYRRAAAGALERFPEAGVLLIGTSRPAAAGFIRLGYGPRWREVIRG